MLCGFGSMWCMLVVCLMMLSLMCLLVVCVSSFGGRYEDVFVLVVGGGFVVGCGSVVDYFVFVYV